MPYSRRVEMLAQHLRLTPYQTYVLGNNSSKYDFSRLVKRGSVLYAPYLCDDKHSAIDYCSRLLFGPRADLIGADKMLIRDRRGIKIYSTGFHSAHRLGVRYYADPTGNRIERDMFMRIT
ncbi:MAG: hypothetical protein LBF28_03570 [Rickettsiales bacterium]|jgi:hypothetical protein|nr:hypothetical protein [Rickettsiales bacterium]